VDGISANGLFANSELEADITRAFAAQSEKTCLLCDASKIGKEGYLKFAKLKMINTIITDSQSEILEQFTKQGIKVIRV